MIPYSRQKIFNDDINEVVRVLKSDFLTKGKKVLEFEKKISLKTKSKYALSCNSGSSALHLACLAIGLKKGDCVWTSRGEYCLNGITRSKAIYLCEKNDINCYQKDFTFDEIKDCDEAFVTGTFAGIIPVSSIENRKLLSINSNSLTNHIRNLYNNYIIENLNKT